METLEKSRSCRLCGKTSGIAVDIFDKNESHVRKINAILPILVHEMDLLPKQMCHRCSYKLEEFYNFYVECAKTDTELKSQLSWMRKENLVDKIVTPMVKMNRYKIKTEPPDDSDSIDPNNVLESISESTILFPSSILQHNLDPNASQMLSCLRCQCFCNKSIKVNKQPSKEVKSSSNAESENHAFNSNGVSNISNKVSEIIEPISVDKNYIRNDDVIEDSSFKNISIKEIPVINLDNGGNSKSENIDNVNIKNIKSEKLNRALRPRKGSVNYVAQKKRVIATNLKEKLNKNLNLFDPALVNPVKISQNNSIQSRPIIKLEKVDDTMKSLRASKNLEEFNKRIKERRKDFSRGKKMVLPGGVIQNKTNISDESQNTRSLQKEENFIRKSLQKEENIIRKSFQKEENSIRKSLQKEENCIRKSLQKEEYTVRKSLQKEENTIRKSIQKEENESRKNLQREENQCRKNLQINESMNRKNLQKEENQSKTSLQTENSESKKSLQIEKDENNEKKSMNFCMKNGISDIVMGVTEGNMKQKTVDKGLDNKESQQVQTVQDKSCGIDFLKNQELPKSMDRLPICAVVKLEKDYTCNVDYPRIQIKKHIDVGNSSQSHSDDNDTLEIPEEQASIIELALKRKSMARKDDNVSPKILRSKEKSLNASINKDKLGKESKKKGKQSNLNKTKRISLDKYSSGVSTQVDLKRYCEECDTCFRNKELYQLHPCYQK